MQCSKGPYAKRPPADWDRIQTEFPSIIHKVQSFNKNGGEVKIHSDDNANIASCHNNNLVTNSTVGNILPQMDKKPIHNYTRMSYLVS